MGMAVLHGSCSLMPSFRNISMGFPHSSVGKESTCNAGDLSSISVLGRSHGEGNGNLLQYFCLENPMYWEAWQATIHRVTKTQTQLSIHTYGFVPPPRFIRWSPNPQYIRMWFYLELYYMNMWYSVGHTASGYWKAMASFLFAGNLLIHTQERYSGKRK